MELWNDIIEITWSSGKKDEQLKSRIWYHERTPEGGINHLEETIIRITLCLAFTNLDWWQAMDFCILLIVVERIKIDIAQTWESLHRTIGRIETTNKLIW